jgi:DNA cross-link repair 1A protein
MPHLYMNVQTPYSYFLRALLAPPRRARHEVRELAKSYKAMATQHSCIKRLRAPLSRFIVDGFNFCEPDVRHYFLTHSHADHTTGLTASFDLGEVYCSALTARMLRATIGVKAKLIHTIEVGESIEVEGARVTALDAGHCPGALMFLFEAEGHRALHTGDCRASPDVVAAAAAACGPPGRGGLDTLYLDTTYASPRWDFPPQPESLSMMQRIVEAELAREPRTLFIVGSYSVGKTHLVNLTFTLTFTLTRRSRTTRTPYP